MVRETHWSSGPVPVGFVPLEASLIALRSTAMPGAVTYVGYGWVRRGSITSRNGKR